MSEAKSYLFYAGQVVQEWQVGEFIPTSQYLRYNWGLEIYNGGYIWSGPKGRWYRCDSTPVLDVDVPNEYKLLLILLN